MSCVDGEEMLSFSNSCYFNLKNKSMIAHWCGFNGFKQILDGDNSIAFSFIPIPLEDIKDISFAWDCAVILSVCDVYISGFHRSVSSCLKKISKPNEAVQFSKVSCNEKYALLITEDGECWQFFYDPPKWKQLLNFCSVEETESSSTKEVENINAENKKLIAEEGHDKSKKTILKICCGGILNVALDNQGVCYSIPSPIMLPGIKIIDVACGFEHSLILDEFGRVFSWGSGMRGQLGHNVLETRDCPVEVDALSGLQITSIAAGGWHSAAVTYSGILYTWGWNNSGQLGFPSFESSESVSTTSSIHEEEENIEGEATTVDIVNLQRNDTDVRENERLSTHVKRFKFDVTRKIQAEEDQNENFDKKICFEGSGNKEINDSSFEEKRKESCIFDTSNAVKNSAVDLDKSSTQRHYVTVLAVPQAVSFPCEEDAFVTEVSCGNRHTVLLTGNGSVWGCGWNVYGQLGKSPDVLISSDSLIKLNIKSNNLKICKIICGGWNTAVFFQGEEKEVHL